MARRVLLHVGAPKTGTSFVQDRLFLNPGPLAEQGLTYPGERHDAHFLAALDLMQLTWGGLESQAVGAWDRLVAEVRAAPGTAVISHEILGHASRAHVAKALADLGTGADGQPVEIDLLLSARDLVRQVPAEWQENLKHRRIVGYGEFLDLIRDPARPGVIAQWFWAVQDVPDILDRWGSTLAPERVHVVTVPQAGAARSLLWERFASVLGVDPESLPESTDRANASIGVPEAALLLRLNQRLREVLANERYRQFVREHLVHQTLAKVTGSPRLTLPPDAAQWAAEVSADWASVIGERGYDVVGDLDDLRVTVASAPGSWSDPDAPDEGQVAEAAINGLAAMTREAARLRDVEIELHEVIAARDAELARFHGAPSYRVKRRVVRTAETNPLARAGLTAWRAALRRPRA